MPGNTKYGERRSRYKRHRKSKGHAKAGDVATRAYVNRRIGKQAEIRVFSVNNTMSSVYNAGQVSSSLTAYATGDTNGSREGDKLNIKAFRFKFSYNFTASQNTRHKGRIVICQFMGNTATDTLAPFNFVDPSASTLSTGYAPNYLYNPAQVEGAGQGASRIRILWDSGMFAHADTMQDFNIVPEISKVYEVTLHEKAFKPLTYNSGSTTGSGQIFVFAINNDTVSGPDELVFSCQCIYTA